MAPPGQSGSQPLPPKEQALFKKIVKCYEHKQYRNGLRSAKQILSNAKYADHGETLAMKGLIMNCMGRKEEALDHVRRGLTKDLKSHVCWHVFGLVQRSEKKYDEAIKAYRNALKLDKDNMQILRDLSLLQIQMRDLEGYRDTRYTLLTLRPQQKASWVGYAMAYHLLKDYDMALRILEEFRKSNSPTGFDYEHSELLLYQNMVLREADRAQDAMDHLKKHEKEIFDVVAKAEIRERAAYIFDARKMKIEMKMKVTSAELLIKESRVPEATQIYKDLIDRNPECMDYYKSYERCLDLFQPDSRNKRSELYMEFCAAYPRASAPKRIALSFASGQEFEDALFKFLTAGFRKGLPALFQQVKSLYQKDEQREAIGQVVLRTKDSLENDGRIPGDDPKGARESPTTLLWVYYYLAQHFDLLKDPEQAMSYINKALDHTPTLIELLCVKAKILKHGGNASEAVKCMEEAQSLDTADRFINSKCAKYMLRAGLIPEAEAMCAKFTREGVNPVQNLNEMQCMWFEIECAKAHLRLGNIGEALKKCHEVDRHFLDITEDQFDFHTYCVRKMTLCAYVKLLRLEDGLRNHRFYIRAATIAIEIYLQLHDSPGGSRVNGVEGEGMSESEKRKQQRKKKKAEAKGQKDTPKENSGGGGKGKEKGDDVEAVAHQPLNPESLLNTSDPMEEAVKFLSPLIQLNSREIKIYTLGFEVYFRRKKVLPMLQCLMRAHQLDPIDPDYHLCRVKFLKFLEGKKYEGPVSEIISHSLPTLYGDKLPSPEDCNTVFEKSHENSLPHRIAACEAWQFLEKNTSNLVEKATSLSDSLSGRTWETCQQTLAKLRRGAFGTVAEKLAENYRAECEQLFPGANCFQLPESKQPIINNNGGTTSPVGNHHIENSHSDQDELAKKTANLKI